MFELLSSPSCRKNDNVEGFGHHWTDKISPYARAAQNWGLYTENDMPGLVGGTSKRVCT